LAALPWYIEMKFIGIKNNKAWFRMKIDKRWIFLKHLERLFYEFLID